MIMFKVISTVDNCGGVEKGVGQEVGKCKDGNVVIMYEQDGVWGKALKQERFNEK